MYANADFLALAGATSAAASDTLAACAFFAGAFFALGFAPCRGRSPGRGHARRYRSIRSPPGAARGSPRGRRPRPSRRGSRRPCPRKGRAQLGGGHRLLLDIFDELRRSSGRYCCAACMTSWFISCSLTRTWLRWPISERSRPRRTRRSAIAWIFVALRFHLGAGGLGIGLVARLMLELLPDLLELGLDHRGRHREIVAGGELVEQLALHVGAGEAVQLLLDLAPEQAAQLVEPLRGPSTGRSRRRP